MDNADAVAAAAALTMILSTSAKAKSSNCTPWFSCLQRQRAGFLLVPAEAQINQWRYYRDTFKVRSSDTVQQ